MNKDSIIGFIVIAAILVGYSVWMTPSQEEMEARQRKIDSISMVRQQHQLLDSVRMAAEIKRIEESVAAETVRTESTATGVAQPDNFTQLKERFGAFATAALGTDSTWVVENEVFELTVNAKGGVINKVVLKDYQTWDSLPLVIFDPNNIDFNLSFFSRNRNINTNELYFQPYLNGFPYDGSKRLDASNTDSLTFSMRLMADNGMGQLD
ncbi:MAG: YidC/Oxa1 family insertase periplasmic-domain containing protein, partial [Bacteroidales bacterium]|nr:YidC/Oxa1 family insertase periplasmic-domain containing protein [Bacteroidales bacterium]